MSRSNFKANCKFSIDLQSYYYLVEGAISNSLPWENDAISQMNLWLHIDTRTYRADTITQYTLRLMAAWSIWHSMVEIFSLIVKEMFSHHSTLCYVRQKTLLGCCLEDLGRSTYSLIIHNSFNSCPAPHNACPPNDWVEHYCVRMDNHVLKDDWVFYASAVTYLNLSANGHVRTDLSSSMDFSWGVDADNALDLVRVDVSWLGQNHRLHWLVVIHIVFLCLE